MNRLLPYLKYWKPATFALAVIVALVSGYEVKQSWIREGELRERNAHLEQSMKSLTQTSVILAKKSAHQDTVITERVKTLTKTRVAYKVLHDTLYSSDTVEIPAIVQLADSALVAADSLNAAKDVLIGTLHAELSVRDSMLAVSHAQLKLALNQKPSRFSRVANAAKWGLVGAGVVAVIRR